MITKNIIAKKMVNADGLVSDLLDVLFFEASFSEGR
jgi:hypothetical protein